MLSSLQAPSQLDFVHIWQRSLGDRSSVPVKHEGFSPPQSVTPTWKKYKATNTGEQQPLHRQMLVKAYHTKLLVILRAFANFVDGVPVASPARTALERQSRIYG